MSVDYDGKNWKVHFYEADIFELNKILLSAERKYPLIWLQTGYEKRERINGGRFELQNLSFFIITKGDQTDRYKKRFATSFEEILYPILGDFLSTIRNASGISFGSETYKTTDLPFNNVADLISRQKIKPETTTVTDIWDAVIVDMNLTVNPDCYPEYFINN